MKTRVVLQGNKSVDNDSVWGKDDLIREFQSQFVLLK